MKNQTRPDAMTRLSGILVLCITVFLFLQLISINLGWQEQAVFGGVTILTGLLANRLSASRVVTIALMLISMIATFRYGWWRVNSLVDYFSDESNRHLGLDAVFLLLLISAELYTVLIMLLGYMQTAWPLNRTPIALPGDDTAWPHVDLLIPTYNEPLSLVRYTALAALNIDYPPEKLHVYILDDGTRDDFSQFAIEAGVGYITRTDHGHAKAGNINHALTTMDSPYVAIFDCDHVPTRSFLQMTLGWMLVDSNLGMLQTPHHFYSPDPFERNLLQYKTIPNEAELFYGIVQDGNDFWNATFFCGSCALIRRSALDSVGGIATETVTEDAHTSLRMQRQGYNTAYINIPQAAGLATESLAAHVGQRIRWARGMIQILRTDNPLFGRGLKFTQRLCYFNAMAHFLYSVPRLAFLLAPLVYLLLGRTIIPGYWVAIFAYAFPHLILSSLTNSRIQGRHRHSFWNEIYEAVLAPYILAPTLLALINPKLGKFNVTSKGSTMGETQFDRKIATPTRWLLLLNFIGLLVVPYRLFVTDPQHPGAVIMNMVWVIFNIVILGVAAAVALEQKQRRGTVRIEAKLPVRVTTPQGRQFETVSIDMSVGGASLKKPSDARVAPNDILKIAFPSYTGKDEIQAQVIGLVGQTLRIAFQLNTIPEQEILTRALYSRADAWLGSANLKEVDRPLVSLGRVIVLSTYGIYQVCRSVFPERKHPTRATRVKTAAILLAALALGASSRGVAFAKSQSDLAGEPVRPTAAHATAPAPSQVNAQAGLAGGTVLSSAERGDNLQVISLKDMGMKSGIEMHGPHSYSAAHFTLSHQLVPKQGTLKLNYQIDPALDPRSTSLHISLNGTEISTIHPGQATVGKDGLTTANIPVSNLLLVRNNTLTFEFTGSEVMEREEQARVHVLCRVFPTSTFEVAGDWLRLGNDLSQLPLPLLDSELQSTTTVPFVFLSQPSPTMLEAAGAVASWFGAMSGTQAVRFAVSLADIPPGNAVILSSNRSMLPADLQIPAGHGPVAALRDNPSDPSGSLLVLAGDSEDEVLSIARTVSLKRNDRMDSSAQGSSLTGSTVESPTLIMPPLRAKDDAPRWLPISKAAPLASCSDPSNLKTDGSSPIPIYFHAPPDLYFGEKQYLELSLNYRYDAALVATGSALRVTVNQRLISEIALPPGSGLMSHRRVVRIPVENIQPFGNTVLFSFDFVPANRNSDSILSGEILCDSTLDLHGLKLWARMPDLELFADSGFPFTQFADLSRTVVVLPTDPTPEEIALYLHLMSYFGAQTGFPALRVTVTGPSNTIGEGRDYLILGTVADQPAFSSLASLLPASLTEDGAHIRPLQGLSATVASLENSATRRWSSLIGKGLKDRSVLDEGTHPDAMVEEIESPVSAGRSIVTIVLRQKSAADKFAAALLDPSQSSGMAGSLTLLRDSTFQSFESNDVPYHVGDLSWFATMRLYLTRYFLLLLIVVLCLSFLTARFVYGWMAWHAQQRLILAEPSAEEDESREFTAP
jgi:cellulose synthase (UDP-forming)